MYTPLSRIRRMFSSVHRFEDANRYIWAPSRLMTCSFSRQSLCSGKFSSRMNMNLASLWLRRYSISSSTRDRGFVMMWSHIRGLQQKSQRNGHPCEVLMLVTTSEGRLFRNYLLVQADVIQVVTGDSPVPRDARYHLPVLGYRLIERVARTDDDFLRIG